MKLLKKGLSIVMSAALIMTLPMGKIEKAYAASTHSYTIVDASGLANLQIEINNELQDNMEFSIIVANNITANASFTGIDIPSKNNSVVKIYSKVGNSYTISNINRSLNSNNGTPAGGFINSVNGVDVEISNLNLNLNIENGIQYSAVDKPIGGFIGQANNCNVTILDSNVMGSINCPYNNYIGGVIGAFYGSNKSLRIASVQSATAVTGYKYVGGIAGYLKGKSSLEHCTNQAPVLGISYVGGIAGYVSSGTVSDSLNVGEVKYNTSVSDNTIQYIGGNIGYSSAEATNLINSGNVTINAPSSDVSNIGGNIGYNAGKVTYVENMGKVTVTGRTVTNVAGNIGLNKSGSNTVEDLKNNAAVDGGDNATNVGGNVGASESGNISDLTNNSTVTGDDNVGGNVGSVTGGSATDAENHGNVNGNDNVGGNVGQAGSGTTTEDLVNNGSVNGSTDVGGNVGENSGTNSGDINTGDVNGSSGVGGNVGNNTNTGSVDSAQNGGDVNGNSNTDGNIGSNSGSSENTKDLSDAKTDAETGDTQIISPSDDSNTYTDPLNITYEVDPRGAGAIYNSYLSKTKVSVLAKPVEGYKFVKWVVSKATIESGNATDTSVTVKFEDGATIKASFEKVNSGQTIVDAQTPVVKYESGLKISAEPAEGGSIIQLVSIEGDLVLDAVANNGYSFEKWKIGGSVTLANGSSYTNSTANFKFSENEKNSIAAVFKKGNTTVVVDAPVSGPKAGSVISNANFNFKVTKAGKTKGALTGEVAVKSLKKASLKKISIGSSVTIDGVKYNITSIMAKAFKGNK